MTQPGWYTDPADPTTSRFWSGSAWTAARHWNGGQWIDLPPAPLTVAAYPGADPTSVPYPESYQFPPMPIGAPVPGPRTDRRLANRAYLAIAGAVLVVIGCALPWATQDYGFGTISINGTSAGGGQFDLVLGLAVVALTVLSLVGRTGWKSSALSLALTVLIVIVCIANMADISNVIDQERAAETDALVSSSTGTSFGLGIILVLVGGCIAGIGTLLTILSQRKTQRR